MSKKILIIDDEVNIIKVMKSRLTASGYTVISADKGKAGIQSAESDHPDLILLDLVLPDIDGFEVLRLLKESAVTGHIPVLILTVQDMHEQIAKAKSRKAVDYIVKPFSPEGLINKIKKYCPVSV